MASRQKQRNMVGQELIEWCKRYGQDVHVRHLRLTPETARLAAEAGEYGRTGALLHYARPVHVIRLAGETVHANGGVTEVTVVVGTNPYVARAFCSTEDTFSRRVGLLKATGRLFGMIQRSGFFDDFVPA